MHHEKGAPSRERCNCSSFPSRSRSAPQVACSDCYPLPGSRSPYSAGAATHPPQSPHHDQHQCLSVPSSGSYVVFWPCELCKLPRLPLIEGYLSADDLQAAANVRIACNLDGAGRCRPTQADHMLMCRGSNIAELMLMWLMMYSGLYHQPSSEAISASTWGGNTRLSKKW